MFFLLLRFTEKETPFRPLCFFAALCAKNYFFDQSFRVAALHKKRNNFLAMVCPSQNKLANENKMARHGTGWHGTASFARSRHGTAQRHPFMGVGSNSQKPNSLADHLGPACGAGLAKPGTVSARPKAKGPAKNGLPFSAIADHCRPPLLARPTIAGHYRYKAAVLYRSQES